MLALRHAATRSLAISASSSSSSSPTPPPLAWDRVARAGRAWAAPREPRPDDHSIALFRDANAWCPFSHRVWFWIEQLELRYKTTRVHLGGDPREPAKQASYLSVSPRGTCPALRIDGDTITESLDILWRLEREFPRLPSGRGRPKDDARVAELLRASGAFDTDCDEWLHNTRPGREAALRAAAVEKLAWLEAALAAEGGPFLLGAAPSIVDAAFVGFLTRLDTNYRHFKALDVRAPAARTPRLAAWLAAIEATAGGAATRQEAWFEQRVYQAHPARRAAAEPCMGLHPTVRGVGEPPSHGPPPPPEGEAPAAPLVSGGAAALEAAWRLQENREALGGFLRRKRREAARVAAGGRDAAPTTHWKAAGQRGPPPGASWSADAPAPAPAPEPEPSGAAADGGADEPRAVDAALLGLAGVLAGLCTPAEAVARLGGAAALCANPVAELGGLVGTPRDMSVAAAVQLRAALREMAVVP